MKECNKIIQLQPHIDRKKQEIELSLPCFFKWEDVQSFDSYLSELKVLNSQYELVAISMEEAMVFSEVKLIHFPDDGVEYYRVVPCIDISLGRFFKVVPVNKSGHDIILIPKVRYPIPRGLLTVVLKHSITE